MQKPCHHRDGGDRRVAQVWIMTHTFGKFLLEGIYSATLYGTHERWHTYFTEEQTRDLERGFQIRILSSPLYTWPDAAKVEVLVVLLVLESYKKKISHSQTTPNNHVTKILGAGGFRHSLTVRQAVLLYHTALRWFMKCHKI